MSTIHPIDAFHPIPSEYEKQLKEIPFELLPLYVNHRFDYARYFARTTLAGKKPFSYNKFMQSSKYQNNEF